MLECSTRGQVKSSNSDTRSETAKTCRGSSQSNVRHWDWTSLAIGDYLLNGCHVSQELWHAIKPSLLSGSMRLSGLHSQSFTSWLRLMCVKDKKQQTNDWRYIPGCVISLDLFPHCQLIYAGVLNKIQAI